MCSALHSRSFSINSTRLKGNEEFLWRWQFPRLRSLNTLGSNVIHLVRHPKPVGVSAGLGQVFRPKSVHEVQTGHARRTILAILALSLTLVALPAAEKAHAQDVSESRGAITLRLEERVLHYTNEARKLEGLPPLKRSIGLNVLARGHSSHMCRTRTFQHESPAFPPGWSTFSERLRQAGVRSGGENIGYLTLTTDADAWARRMVEGWMKGPAHRKNILNPQFRYMGVGVRRCSNDLAYATQVLSPEPGRAP